MSDTIQGVGADPTPIIDEIAQPVKTADSVATLCPEDKAYYDQTVAEVRKEEEAAEQTAMGYRVLTTHELAGMSFPELHFIVPDIIPEGLTLVAGPPKTGKSMFCATLASALAAGTTFLDKQLELCEVLYVPLEYAERTFQLLYNRVKGFPSNRMHVFFKEPGNRENILEQLRNFLGRHLAVRVVVIDTFGLIKGPNLSRMAAYDHDITEMMRLKQFSLDCEISLLLVHHTRKSAASQGDTLEEVYGTFGLTGTTDNNLILHRPRKSVKGTMHIISRNIPDAELALGFGEDGWTLLGDADLVRLSDARRDILAAMGTGTVSIKDIAGALEKNYNTTAHLVQKMVAEGYIVKEGNGYRVPKP